MLHYDHSKYPRAALSALVLNYDFIHCVSRAENGLPRQ